nr:hypothetical protein GCM10025730_54570 [Promicromonospora thailandica]
MPRLERDAEVGVADVRVEAGRAAAGLADGLLGLGDGEHVGGRVDAVVAARVQDRRAGQPGVVQAGDVGGPQHAVARGLQRGRHRVGGVRPPDDDGVPPGAPVPHAAQLPREQDARRLEHRVDRGAGSQEPGRLELPGELAAPAGGVGAHDEELQVLVDHVVPGAVGQVGGVEREAPPPQPERDQHEGGEPDPGPRKGALHAGNNTDKARRPRTCQTLRSPG